MLRSPNPPTGAEQSRWFGRRAALGAMTRKETVTAGGGSFQAVFQRSNDGGYVVSLPAIPHLMTRGATYEHARLQALTLVHGYLRELRTQNRPASQGRSQLPRERPLAA